MFFSGSSYSTDTGEGSGGRGAPGVTPHIGQNGNWWIGTKDTGVKAVADDGNPVVKIAIQGGNLIVTHRDTAKVQIPLPTTPGSGAPPGIQSEIQALEAHQQQLGVDVAGIKSRLGSYDHAISELQGVDVWSGPETPTLPASKKSAYFWNFKGTPTQQFDENVPQVSGQSADAGTILFINNENPDSTLTLRAQSGGHIDNGTHTDIGPNQFALLVSAGGGEWTVAESGYIPSNYHDLINRVGHEYHDELHTKNEIVGFINDWFSNPATQSALDAALKKLGYQHAGGHVPVNPHPSTVKVHLGVADDYPSGFSGEIGNYAPHQKLTVTGLDSTPHKVWIAAPANIANTVSGISVNGGLAASWSSKNISVNGAQWAVFLSPFEFHSASLTFDIQWSI